MWLHPSLLTVSTDGSFPCLSTSLGRAAFTPLLPQLGTHTTPSHSCEFHASCLFGCLLPLLPSQLSCVPPRPGCNITSSLKPSWLAALLRLCQDPLKPAPQMVSGRGGSVAGNVSYIGADLLQLWAARALTQTWQSSQGGQFEKGLGKGSSPTPCWLLILGWKVGGRQSCSQQKECSSKPWVHRARHWGWRSGGRGWHGALLLTEKAVRQVTDTTAVSSTL